MGYMEDLRKVIGNQPLNLMGVAVAVVNDAGEFLLQKRRDGQWGVPGEARFFSVSELPDRLNPLIKNLMNQFALTFERPSYAEKSNA